MGKRSKKAQAAKAKRQAAARRARNSNWFRHWPYLAFGGVAAAFVAALVLVSAGSGSTPTQVEASYPDGYVPPAIGLESAPVEMVMWGDFQCPFCRRFDLSTLPELVSRYTDSGQVKFVWRNFENYGSESHDAAVAAHCAGEQGKFWEYHGSLYENQRGVNSGVFTPPNLRRLADELGLETEAFNACLAGISYDSVISADKRLGRSLGVNSTPTFFINGEMTVGAQPTETFVQLIESALSEAQEPSG
jgi:protein-disulfide isomerase